VLTGIQAGNLERDDTPLRVLLTLMQQLTSPGTSSLHRFIEGLVSA
jgi:hypothetical protein